METQIKQWPKITKRNSQVGRSKAWPRYTTYVENEKSKVLANRKTASATASIISAKTVVEFLQLHEHKTRKPIKWLGSEKRYVIRLSTPIATVSSSATLFVIKERRIGNFHNVQKAEISYVTLGASLQLCGSTCAWNSLSSYLDHKSDNNKTI